MYRILIVDDSSVDRKGMRKLLEKSQYKFVVYEACNGMEALEVVKRNDIDIILTDIRMPKMDGIELLEKVDSLKKETLSIILSAYSDFEYVQTAIENHVDFYMLKPIKISEFNRVLSKAVEKVKNIKQNHKDEDEIIKNMLRYDDRFGMTDQNNHIASTLRAIENKKWDKVASSIREMFENLESERKMSFLYIRQIVIVVLKKMYEGAEDKDNLFRIVNVVMSLQSIERIKEYMLDIVDEFCSENAQDLSEKNVQNRLVRNVLDVIHKRYAEDISLDSVAYENNITSKYLGKLFKQHCNMGFVKYLTEYRLEIAKEMLLYSQKKILEIARDTGFRDTSYFCALFRKKYGLSPEQYRKTGDNQ